MLTNNLLETLEDIVKKIEIKTDFSVHHADYKPLELPLEVVERLQKMPKQMQQKYLSLQLRSFLYGIYYNGSLRSVLALDREENNLPQDLENNSVLGVDLEFYEQLHNSNQGEGYFDYGWYVLREEPDDTLAVTQGGLRLHIHRDKHLSPAEKSAIVGDIVAVRLPKNRVQNGFYLAVGNQGFTHLENEPKNSVTVRIYFNFTPEGAVGVMGTLTQQLNDLAIPFSFKVLYNPQDYGRHDSGVLYFDKPDYQQVKTTLQDIYLTNQSYFHREIPLFTMQLAPGLSLAEEPNQKFVEKESFGMNRCQIIANGLLKAWYQGDNSIDGRMQAINAEFSQLGIDLAKAYLNAGSEDIYQSWE